MTYWDSQNGYFFHTGHFKLPYGKIYELPDGLSGIGHLAEAEYHKYQVIDFQMRGGARAFGNRRNYVSGIIAEGSYSQGYNDGQVIVELDQFQGIIDDVVVGDENQQPVWSGLDPAKDQYLYIKLVEQPDTLSQRRTSAEFNDFDALVEDSSGNTDKDTMLVAKRSSGLGSAIDFDLDHKVYVNLLKHIEDANPHGPTWIQDDIIASGITAHDVTVEQDVMVDEFDAETTEVDSLAGYRWPTGILQNDAIFRAGIQTIDDVEMDQLSGVSLQASVVLIGHDTEAIIYNSGTSIGSFQLSSRDIDNRIAIALSRGVRQVAPPSMVQSGAKQTTHVFGDVVVSGHLGLQGSQFQIDEVRPSVQGELLDNHIVDVTNPHQLTPVRLSGLGQFGIGDPNQWSVDPYSPPPESPYWRMQANLAVESGISIDGVDVSEISRMLDATVIDSSISVSSGLPSVALPGNPTNNRHVHLMLPLQGSIVATAPEYQNMCVSGLSPGTFETHRQYGNNWYDWYTHAKEEDVLVYASLQVPEGRDKISNLSIMAYSDDGNEGEAKFQIQVRDTDGVVLGAIPKEWYSPSVESPETFVFSGGGIGSNLGGVFESGEYFDVLIRMRSASGIGVHVGPMYARFF